MHTSDWNEVWSKVVARQLSNNMLHATCTQGNQVDSWLLLVRNQTANLTPDPSFGHNLCFRCPNGQYKPILNIYIPRAFQWYKEHLKPLRFDPCNCPLKIRKSTGTPTPKVELPRGCEGSFPHTLLHSREYVVWLMASFLAHNLANPRFGREPKARVTTIIHLANLMFLPFQRRFVAHYIFQFN